MGDTLHHPHWLVLQQRGSRQHPQSSLGSRGCGSTITVHSRHSSRSTWWHKLMVVESLGSSLFISVRVWGVPISPSSLAVAIVSLLELHLRPPLPKRGISPRRVWREPIGISGWFGAWWGSWLEQERLKPGVLCAGGNHRPARCRKPKVSPVHRASPFLILILILILMMVEPPVPRSASISAFSWCFHLTPLAVLVGTDHRDL